MGKPRPGGAAFAAKLKHAGLAPAVVGTGANRPPPAEVFPRGEAVHFSEHAPELGVPASAIIIEPAATNTGENITRSRDALREAGIQPASGTADLQAVHGAPSVRHVPQSLARGRGHLPVQAVGADLLILRAVFEFISSPA